MNHIRIISLLLCAIVSLSAPRLGFAQDEVCQTDTLVFEIKNPLGGSVILPGIGDNAATMVRLTQSIIDLKDGNLIKVVVSCGTSPEGSYSINEKLAKDRAASVVSYIINTTSLPFESISVINEGVRWNALRAMAEKSEALPFRNKVIETIDNLALAGYSTNLKTEGRMAALQTLGGGEPMAVMSKEFFPALRSTYVYLVTPRSQEPEIKEEPTIEEPAPIVVKDTVVHIVAAPDTSGEERFFWMKLKTNLLYGAATVANLGLEFNMGKHLSFTVPVTFSPYTVNPECWRLRTLSVQPELRFWFSQAGDGHFLGLHGHAAYYNITTPFDTNNRFQDRDGNSPLLGGGLSYGYSFRFGKKSRWGMEMTVGGGYARLSYDTFYNIENGACYNTQTKDYWGLTNAAVSIYYKFVDRKWRSEK